MEANRLSRLIPTSNNQANNPTITTNAAKLFTNIHRQLLKTRPMGVITGSLEQDLDKVTNNFLNSNLADFTKLQIVNLALNTFNAALEKTSNLKFGDGKPITVGKDRQTGQLITQSQTELRTQFHRQISSNPKKVNQFRESLLSLKEALSFKLTGEQIKTRQVQSSFSSNSDIRSMSTSPLSDELKEFSKNFLNMLSEYFVIVPDESGEDKQVFLLDAVLHENNLPPNHQFHIHTDQDVYDLLKMSLPVLDFYFKVEKDVVNSMGGIPNRLSSLGNILNNASELNIERVKESFAELRNPPKYIELGIGSNKLTENNGLTIREDFLGELKENLEKADLNSDKLLSNLLVEVRAEQYRNT